MAVPSGSIIVADPDAFGGAGGILAVHPATGAQQVITQGGMLADPAGLAIAADGTIFVADLQAFGSGGIVAVDPTSGQQRKVSASTVFTRPMGLAVAPDGRLVVAYLNEGDGVGKIMLVNPTNAEHHATAPTTQFITPADVVVDATGAILVADADVQGFNSRLRRIDANGVVMDLVTDQPAGAMYVGIAVTGNDLVVVSNGNGEFKFVLRFVAGNPTPVTISANGLMENPFGVVLESSGKIVVADRFSGVLRIDPATGAQTVLAADGSIESPIAVALAR
jgi:DNA-binding beta-propeller fold protein YncE